MDVLSTASTVIAYVNNISQVSNLKFPVVTYMITYCMPTQMIDFARVGYAFSFNSQISIPGCTCN